MECEKEEDDKYKAENGEHEDAHDQVHCRERSLHLVRVVRDGVGLVQQVAHGPTHCHVMYLDRGRRKGGQEGWGRGGGKLFVVMQYIASTSRLSLSRVFF